MVLRLAKINALGNGTAKMVAHVDNNTLASIEHTALAFSVNTLVGSEKTHMRRLGIFLGLTIAYNLLLSRVASSEVAGNNR